MPAGRLIFPIRRRGAKFQDLSEGKKEGKGCESPPLTKRGKHMPPIRQTRRRVKIRRGNAGGKRFHSKEARPTA